MFRQGQGQGPGAIVPDAVTEAPALDPLAMPALQRQPAKHALTEFWERVIAAMPAAEQQRRLNKSKELPILSVKLKLLDEVLKEASNLAEAAYEKEERDMPKQLCTAGPVMAFSSARRPRGQRNMMIWYRAPADAPAWTKTHFVIF